MIPEILNFSILPSLNLKVQVFFRIVSGALFLSYFIINIPLLRLYFRNKLYGGYHDNVGLQKLLTPRGSNFILAIWITCTLGIILDRHLIGCLFVNLIFSYYFFIRLRWRSLARGMGAPGFMYFWLAACLFLIEVSTQYAMDARPWVILMFQFDLGIIMLSAGVYKITSGYLTNNGMELGMVNPQWGYWSSFYKKLNPKSFLFYFLNQGAWINEIFGGILMLIPQTRLLGGLIIAASFLFVGTQIRLGNLVYVVIAGTIIFIHEGSFLSDWLVGLSILPDRLAFGNIAWLSTLLIYFSIAYMVLRPIALLGLYYNFYAHRKLPALLQTTLEKYANTFGIILWRVFTIEVINFYVDISIIRDGKREKISYYNHLSDGRFNQVAEAITVTTIFTALKYFPHNLEIFNERVRSYVRTLPASSVVIFEYYRLIKSEKGFEFLKAAEYTVQSKEILENILIPELNPRGATATAAAHACMVPGSYLEAKS